MATGGSFRDNQLASEIEQAELLELFTGQGRVEVRPSAGKETWCVVWSQDNEYVAWSSGSGLIRILEWRKYRQARLQTAADIDYNTDPVLQSSDQCPVDVQAGELVWSLSFCVYPQHQKHRKLSTQNGRRFRYKTQFEVLLAAGLNSGRIRIWDLASRTIFLELLDHRCVVRHLHISPDSSCRLASAGRDGVVKIWDLLDDGNLVKSVQPTEDERWLQCCAWSPDGNLLCAGGESRMVTVWDAQTYQELHSLTGHCHTVSGCDFCPDGTLLATASYDTSVIIWDPYTGNQLHKLQHLYPAPLPIFAGGGNSSYVRSVAFSPDGTHITTVCDDSYVRFWNLTSADPQQITSIPNALVCNYSPDGSTLAVGTRNGSVSLWSAPMRVQTLQQHCRAVVRCTFSMTSLHLLGLPKRFLHYLSSPSLPIAYEREE